MEELMEILKGIREDVDFENCEDLVDGSVLDSFDILQIISEVNEEFDISIPATEIVPTNFNSATALWALIQKQMDE